MLNLKKPASIFSNKEPKHILLVQKNKINAEVSIIIPCYYSHIVLPKLIKSFQPTKILTEYIFVDDNCPFSAKAINPNNNISFSVIQNHKNGGFSHAVNIGAKYANAETLIFLNADTILTPNWLEPLYQTIQDKEIGIVGNLHLRPDKTIDSCGSEWCKKTKQFHHIGRTIYHKEMIKHPFTLNNVPKDIMQARDVEMVTAACFAIKKETYNKINGFDPEYKKAYWEDADFNMKIKHIKKRIYWIPNSVIIHEVQHTKSLNHKWQEHNKQRFYKKWLHNL